MTATVDHATGQPHPRLRGLVAPYLGYNESGGIPGTHRGLPSPWLTVILTLHEPMRLSQRPDGSAGAVTHHAMLGGLHQRPALIVHDGSQSGVQVSVHPLAARTLLGVPAGEVAGLDVELSCVLGGAAEDLRAEMLACGSWTRRFAVLDAFLTARLASVDRPVTVAAEVRVAWHRLLQSGGRIRVGELADEVGWSPRHLQSRFAAELGLNPKTAARIIRFDRARRRLRPGELSDTAAAHGFSDQAHLTREFHDLAGCSPSQWISEEFGFVQAPAAAPGRP